MKLDAFEKMIRKIVREEIEYSMEKLISNSPKNENISQNKRPNDDFKASLSEFRRQIESGYNEDTNTAKSDWKFEVENNSEFANAPDHLKEALTRDYSALVKKFKK